MTSTEKPHITCHILQSLDGNIDGDFFSASAAMPSIQEYAQIQREFPCDAQISGATTAAQIYAAGYVDTLPPATSSIPRTDWQATTMDKYAVIIDGAGTVNWKRGIVDRRGTKMHIISVLQEDVPDAYLEQLQHAGVSYIFAGKSSLDLSVAVRKLSQYFGISSMLLCGGGVVDYAFLQAGLIDEISILVAPVIDGGTSNASAFDASLFSSGSPVGLQLTDVKQLAGGTVWLRYAVSASA